MVPGLKPLQRTWDKVQPAVNCNVSHQNASHWALKGRPLWTPYSWVTASLLFYRMKQMKFIYILKKRSTFSLFTEQESNFCYGWVEKEIPVRTSCWDKLQSRRRRTDLAVSYVMCVNFMNASLTQMNNAIIRRSSSVIVNYLFPNCLSQQLPLLRELY